MKEENKVTFNEVIEQLNESIKEYNEATNRLKEVLRR